MMKEAEPKDGDFCCYYCSSWFIASDELFYCKECNKYLCIDCLQPKDEEYILAMTGDTLCKKCDQCFYYELPQGIECPDGNMFLRPIECPICSLKKINNEDILKFCFKNSMTTKAALGTKIKRKFKSYKDFKNFLERKTNESWRQS